MPVPYEPTVPSASSSSSKAHTLPDGSYDIYNLGSIYNKPIFIGTTTETRSYSPHQNDTHNITSLQTTTPQAWIQQIASLSVSDPQGFAQLQQQLFAAGFYGSSVPRYGVWRQEDANAAKAAVTGYLGTVNPSSPTPVTLADYLDHAAAQGAADLTARGLNPDGTPKAQTPQIQLTDPRALEATLQGVARAQLGHALKPDQLAAFVNAFHSDEMAAQSTTDPSVTPPNATADAIDYLHGQFGTDVSKHSVQGYTNALLNLFLPSADSRPTINTDPSATSG